MLIAAALFSSLVATRLSLAGPVQQRWADPVVDLPWASYRGTFNETSQLSIFLGVRYAQSPEGENRWRPAKTPLDERGAGVIDAKAFPPECPWSQSGVRASVSICLDRD